MKLVIETACDPARFRLLNDELNELAQTAWPRQGTNREAVAILDHFLAEQDVLMANISAIYIQTEAENGSFTGLRLGVSLAMGLSYALKAPTTPLSGSWDATKAHGLAPVPAERLRPSYSSPPRISYFRAHVIP